MSNEACVQTGGRRGWQADRRIRDGAEAVAKTRKDLARGLEWRRRGQVTGNLKQKETQVTKEQKKIQH